MKSVKTIKVVVVVLVTLAVVLLTTGGILIGMSFQRNSSITDSDVLVSVTPAVSTSIATQTPSPTMVSKDIKTALTDAFTTQDFESIKPHFADNVTLLLYATSCCGDTSDSQEIIEFINRDSFNGKTWEINPAGDQYKGLAETSNYYLVFSNNEAMAFIITGDKITQIMFYQDYRLAGN